MRDGASTGSAPPQDKRTNLPLSTKTRTASTGGSAPASHRSAFAAKASSMNVTNRKDALRDQRAKMLAAAPDWRASDARVNPPSATGWIIALLLTYFLITPALGRLTGVLANRSHAGPPAIVTVRGQLGYVPPYKPP